MRKHSWNLWQLFLVLTVVSGLLYWGDRRGWWDEVRGRVEEGLLAFKVQGSRLKAKTEEAKLRNEIVALNAKVLSLEERVWQLENENKDLRRQLQAPLPPSFKFIPAKVLGSLGDFGELLLGVGKREGVEEGMAVVLEDVFLGKISQVTPRMSRVRLLTHRESRVTVKTQGGARGIVQGSRFKVQGEKTVFLERVLQSEKLAAGEKVMTSGEDGVPADLLVGKVVEVIAEEREPFKSAVMELFVEAGQAERVFVIE